MMNITSETTFLGPARVLETDGARVLVAMPEQKAWATPAMPYTYSAAPGDMLLVIGQADLFYVIGVLSGAGQTVLRAQGDLDIDAPHGRIGIRAKDGVEVHASTVRFVADTWDAVLGSVRQRCKELWSQVTGVARFKSKRRESRVEGTDRVRAGRIVSTAERDVQIDGEKIHLG
jgi:hypothetical protein